MIVLSRAEPLIVLQDEYEFSREPFNNLFVRLTSSLERLRVALLEEDYELASRMGIVISLHFYFVSVDALELLVVEV